MLNVFKNLLQIDGPGARFSARRRSEGIISRATGGVWIILILVQNGFETKQKNKNKTKTLVSSRRPGFAEDCRSVTFR